MQLVSICFLYSKVSLPPVEFMKISLTNFVNSNWLTFVYSLMSLLFLDVKQVSETVFERISYITSLELWFSMLFHAHFNSLLVVPRVMTRCMGRLDSTSHSLSQIVSTRSITKTKFAVLVDVKLSTQALMNLVSILLWVYYLCDKFPHQCPPVWQLIRRFHRMWIT